MRLKLAILFLITLAFLVAYQGQPTLGATTPAVEPSIRSLVALDVDQPTADAIRQQMVPFLKADPFTEFEAGTQLLFHLVSSGKFSQVEITLASGEIYQADVVYAYTLMSSRRVLVVLMLVGMTLPHGRYAYFSEKYAFETSESVTNTAAARI